MRKWVLLGLGLAIAACDAGKATVSPPKRVAASTAVAAASATPGAPGPVASPTAAAALTLQKPSGSFTALSGTITVDPAYIVAAGAGNIVAAGAGNIVAMGGGNIVAAGAGNIVAMGGGNIISGNGSAALTKSRRVLAAEGGVLPAAGMEISVLDLATEVPLPLGKDADGRDVYTVLSNAEGRYELFLPADVGNNVLVVARVPGQDDPRIAYDLATSPGAGVTLDEDSALVTRFIRQTYTSAMERVLRRLLDPTPGAAKELVAAFNVTGAAATTFEKVIAPILDDILVSLKARAITTDGVADEAERQADALLAKIKLSEIKVAPGWGVDNQLALPVLLQALSGARAEIQPRLVGPPPYFPNVPAFKDGDASIRKATDVMEHIVTRYFPDPKLFNGKDPENALVAVGLEAKRAGELMKLARAGGNGISLAITNTFLDAETLGNLSKKVQATPRPVPTAIPHLKSKGAAKVGK